jgi:hypothetical protein
MVEPVAPLNPTNTAQFMLRVLWIAVRIALVYYVGRADVFFYQGF